MDRLSATVTQPAGDPLTTVADIAVTSRATPTVATLFLAHSTQAATPISTQRWAKPSQPIAVSRNQTASQAEAPLYPAIIIYDEQLNADWSVEQSSKSVITLEATDLQFQPLNAQQTLNSNTATIAVSPQADYGTIFFTVRPESGISYKRQSVLGVSFWLNSGSAGIATDDLAVAVLGSNTLPYWTPDDQSVFPDRKGSFSETRLYFLKVNRTIPPNTWLNMVVWLNDLQYDPIYEYVTGFYIKNDAGFRSTYYLDQVALLMAP